MSKWPMRPLGEIAAVTMGQSPPGESYNSDGVGLPFFQGKAEFGEDYPTAVKWCSQPTRIAEAGDILLSVRAPVGPTNFASERCCIGRGLAAIRTDQRIVEQRYLRYFLKRFEANLASRGVGSTFAAINRNDIERIQVPTPPLAEQERLVKLLDEADGLRKLRAEADRRMAEVVPALFYEMFGDPVRNEKAWPCITFGEQLRSLEYGPRFHNEQYSEAGTRIVRITDIDDAGNLDFSRMPRLQIDPETVQRRELIAGDIIFARSGATVGKAAVVPADASESIAGAYFMRVRFESIVEPVFAMHLLRTPALQQIIQTNSKQSAQQNFSGPGFRRLPLILPPLDLQQQFTNRVKSCLEVSRNQANLQAIQQKLLQSSLGSYF